MAPPIVDGEPANEKRLVDFFKTLNEKDRRRFAAIEAKQRGHGGIVYMARVLACSEKTITRGIAELDLLEEDPVAGRIRRPGAGRKKRSSPSHKRKTI